MSILTLPGLIDPHVHLRDPGQTHKEDFYTGTCAALNGGYTTILDMPNNKIPITNLARLDKKIKIAKKKIVCDVGFYFGSLGDNLTEFKKVQKKVLGLKLYLNQTTGNFAIDKKMFERIFRSWADTQSISLHSNILWTKPILVHAEDRMLNVVIKLVEKYKNKVHICHISTISDLKQIILAKENNLPITCGVTPHHLFLEEFDVKTLGPFGKMKPPLRTKKDQDFLWKNLKYIDVVESDHAPHTKDEKFEKMEAGDASGGGQRSASAFAASKARLAGAPLDERAAGPAKSSVPFGVPGLETTLPLLLTAVSENRLSIDDIVRLCHRNPANIFGIKTDLRTKIEINIHKSYIINPKSFFIKCHWSPFDGWKVKGKVKRVFIRGTKVFENDKILVKPGFARVLI